MAIVNVHQKRIAVGRGVVGKVILRSQNLSNRDELRHLREHDVVCQIQSGSLKACVMDVSPDGTKYWNPSCDEAIRHFEGQVFPSLGHGIAFYRHYASVVGFDIRHSSVRKDRDGVVVKNLLVCSREGFKQSADVLGVGNADSDEARLAQKGRRVSNRVGCKAKLLLKSVDNGFFVVHFIELRHNHCLCSDVAKPFLRGNRMMSFQQVFVINCARANIGPNRSFRLSREFVGLYSNISATCVDFKNFKLDLMAYIGNSDANVVVNKYVKKVGACPDYFFQYDLNSEDQLRRLFLVDPVAKQNFTAFGDIVSFDATYETNRELHAHIPREHVGKYYKLFKE
ncbi:PREDICTED: protein FAR1-RELATED SEQUENCE 5-like [Ipomoea nil]|uniref:protein FAR1-RELATED SEQUENCE 5-like n=1 Tax=Ipomoea nil TaxID=35883 RepID=UPI0009018A7C|nr:PREDICTED: protein FAR1-RELATED SEQUENCE 5-like [Ipomoea nil]